MDVTVTLKQVRDQLSDIISRVAFGDKTVVITRFGKPVAAVIRYDTYERFMNPHKRFTKEEWEKGFTLMDKMRENTRNYPEDEVETMIADAVTSVRTTKNG